MLLAVVVSRFVARVTRWPVPIVQIALGVAVFYSGLTSAPLDPHVFFLLFLPPLLFLDGWRIPKDDLRREATTIVTLALGLVVFTVLGVGLLVHWRLPAMPLAVAFALAAVISPTDPIAVSAIAGQTPIPIRMRRILQGEALFNDASGLVCMRVAVAAALTGSFSAPAALGSFLWVASGGLVTGFVMTWLLTRARPSDAVLVGEDGGAQILATLLIPFAAYLLAETLGCSGILAAVAAGITMGYSPHAHWQAVTRIRRTAVWDTLQLVANGSIFVLLGEQLPAIVASAGQTVLITGHQNPLWLIAYVIEIVGALALLRFVWVWASMKVSLLGHRLQVPTAAGTPWRVIAAMSVAGVRGAVTLAAVLTLPLSMGGGRPFPGRDLAIFLAAGVILMSLLMATLALPRLLRGMTLLEPSHRAEADRARVAAAIVAIGAIKRGAPTMETGDSGVSAAAAERLVAIYRQRMAQYDGDKVDSAMLGEANDIERKLRLIGLRAEREAVLRLCHEHQLGEITMRQLVREIDLQEARYTSTSAS